MSRGETQHCCPDCGEVYYTERCDHSCGTEPVAGDYGRKPRAFERCRGCGHTWAVAADGALVDLGMPDPLTGTYSGPERPLSDMAGEIAAFRQEHRCR